MIRRSPLTHKAALKTGEKKLKTRKCAVKGCDVRFTPFSSLVKWCSPEHGAIIGEQALAKKKAREAAASRKLTREQALELKPPTYWAKRAEKACNAYIRKRDEGDPCISCGTYDASEWHAGHCYTVKARPDIRYHEDNIHLQCPKCNTYQGGMVGEYKKRVVSKIGQERLDALAYVNPAFKKTREYYQGIEAHYKAKLKELKGNA
ncbi:MAG TPA: recombination protein NinG [Noviherbaspirillum sp.]|nr:recombination protein NinG [Noviherbaspirillum sp.]